jgi:hypothetical protein
MTGLKPQEAIESVRLINRSPVTNSATRSRYYNPEQQTLGHFRFSQLFIPTTKKAYISYLSKDNYHYFANLGPKTLSSNLGRNKTSVKHRGLNMSMRLCRKVFASWLIKEE